MFSNFKTSYFSLIFISAVCVILFFVAFPLATSAGQVTGYAWSDNIGWIHFTPPLSANCTNSATCGVFYNDSNGQLSGYAWSDNIGWISFNNNLSANGGVGGTAARGPVGGAVSGWARACAGTQSGTCANMNSRTDGWDGWIRFDTGRSNPVTIDGSGNFHGYAWGSDVVGWISFNCLEDPAILDSVCSTTYPDYKVSVGVPSSSSSSSGSGLSSSSSSSSSSTSSSLSSSSSSIKIIEF